MTTARSAASDVQTSDWFQVTVKVGLAAYGLVHLLIAWLALQLAFGDSSGSASQQGAINQLAQESYGQVLLWVIAVGFVALVVWQVLKAVKGHEQEDGAKRTLKRAASAGKAVVFAALALSSAQAAMGDKSGSNTDKMTADLMHMTFGRFLVGALGLVIIGVGVAHVVKGFTRGFEKNLDLAKTPAAETVVRIGQVGYAAKGVSLGLVGGLFCWAAITYDADKSGGLDVALRTLLDAAYGPWLLALVAIGIGCFGVYCFAWARSADPSS